MPFGESKIQFNKYKRIQEGKESGSKIDELFSTIQEGSIQELSLPDLVPYRNHPYKLYEGERKQDLVESIKRHGVIQPIIVRELRPGQYEILAGHNRAAAAKEAGLERIPAIVKPASISDEQAEAIVHITNLIQRGFTELRPSEQAYVVSIAYSNLFSDAKKEDVKNEINNATNPHSHAENYDGSPMGNGQRKMTTAGQEYGLSKNSVARLLRINKLEPTIKNLLDHEIIGNRAAVDLSYLSQEEQENVCLAIAKENRKVDMAAAKRLRAISEKTNGKMTLDDVLAAIDGTANKTKKTSSLSIPGKTLEKWFQPEQSKKERLAIIEKALEQYFR